MPKLYAVLPELGWFEGVFLGRGSSAPSSSMVFAAPEDSIGIIGPPRSGKTSGVLIPAAITWPGSLISASTKTDVLRATRARRIEAGLSRGGDVYVYAPGDPDDQKDGVRTAHWSPLVGCADPAVCEQRASKIIGPKRRDQNEDDFFRQQAATVIRAYFHAAALAGLGMRRVKRWVDENDVSEPMKILESFSARVPSADAYRSSLLSIEKQAPETKSSTFSTVNGKLGPLVNNPVVLENIDRSDFDIDDFLSQGSTLYVVSPENVQEVVAPLIASLVETIVSRAYSLAARDLSGRLDPPLLLLLDEVGAIAPLPTLPQIMAQGASQGVLCVWAAQSFNQLKGKWGEDWANSILGASTHLLIFGGAIADSDLLEKISTAFGDVNVWVNRQPQGKRVITQLLALSGHGSPMEPPHLTTERRLKISDFHVLKQGQAMLIAKTPHGQAFEVIYTPPAATVEPFIAVIAEEAVVQATLQARGGRDPDVLREEAATAAVWRSMSPKEQQRFRREEAALQKRLYAFDGLSGSEQVAVMERDPALANEVRSVRSMASESESMQRTVHTEILRRFVVGEIPHFTYTVLEVPPLPPPPPPPPLSFRPTDVPQRKVERIEGWVEPR
jgi:type IV secretion system protein VirD4